MASNPQETKEATEPKAAAEEPATEKRSSRRRSSVKDLSGTEKSKKGRRGSDKDTSSRETLTKTEKDHEATEKTEKEGLETRTEKDREATEKTEKEASKVSRKSTGSTRSKGSKKGSSAQGASKKSEKEDSKVAKKASKTASSDAGSKRKHLSRGSSKPTKDQEQSGEAPVPQTANSDAMDFFKMRLIAATVVVLISFLFIALAMMGVFKQKDATSSLPCVSQECHETMLQANRLMDSHINPCRDFYRHVCRYWIEKPAGQPPSSFMIDVAHNYTKVWHRELTQDHIQGDYVPLKQDASRFYRSCLSFLEKPVDVGAVTEELFKALKLPMQKWFEERSSENFFHNIIHLSLVNRFHSLVSTTPIVTDSDKTLLIRRESPFHLLVRPIYEQHLGNYASGVIRAIGKQHASDAVVDEVLKLDRKRVRIVVEDGRTERRLEDAGCQAFPTDMWRRALEKVLPSKEQHVAVKMAAADAICADLNAVLVSTTSSARPLYVLTLLAVPVVTYDYELSEDRNPIAVKGVCYRATGAAFEDVWLQLMSSFLSVSSSVESTVDEYMHFIKSRMSDHFRERSWMSERDRSASIGKLAKVQMSRFRGAGLTVRAVTCYTDKFSKSANFTSNLVALRARDVEKCLFYPEFSGNDAHVIKILAGTELIADPETLTVYVPVAFTVSPMYRRRLENDKFVNVAMLGVQLARKVMSLLSRKSFNPEPMIENGTTAPTAAKPDGWSPDTLTNYTAIRKCFLDISASYHRRLDDSQFDDVFTVIDAMRLAYAGKLEYDVQVVRNSEKRQRDSNAAFFKLACLSLCTSRGASPDANSLDFETSYAACLFGATGLPQFAQAFQCRPGDRMWNINRCCVD